MIWLYRICLLFVIGALAAVPPLPAAKAPLTLEAVQALPDPEKRANEATKFAQETVKNVVKTFHDGEVDQGKQMLVDIQTAVELAYESLESTGKDARRKPKHFKRLEIATRKLAGDLTDVAKSLNFDEQPFIEPVIAKVEEINAKLLTAIMTKKKK
jgi:hypothetical protein